MQMVIFMGLRQSVHQKACCFHANFVRSNGLIMAIEAVSSVQFWHNLRKTQRLVSLLVLVLFLLVFLLVQHGKLFQIYSSYHQTFVNKNVVNSSVVEKFELLPFILKHLSLNLLCVWGLTICMGLSTWRSK